MYMMNENMTVDELANYLNVSVATMKTWLDENRFQIIKNGDDILIPYKDNLNTIIQLHDEISSKGLYVAWNPQQIKEYSKWHDTLDEICWLFKVCYSARADIPHKKFRLDQIFVNYLKYHKITLIKVSSIFLTNSSPNSRAITDDLKRGWYNELAYISPLKVNTLGLSHKDIAVNVEISSVRFSFPSWRITTAYYSVYFFLRSLTLLKQNGFRLEEHGKTLEVFKGSLLTPLSNVIWKFPLDISYIPGLKPTNPSILLSSKLPQMKYKYVNHPRHLDTTPNHLFDRIYTLFETKGTNNRTRPSKYTLFDYLHDFRVWANYLDIDNLLNLWGPFYRAYLDQNLSTILFFIAGICEISYLSVFGENDYLIQLQQLYSLMVSKNPQLEQDFTKTSLYQRLVIYKELGFVTGDITLNQKVDPNKVFLQ